MQVPSCPSHLPNRTGEIHIWRVRLDQNSSFTRRLFETLSPDEKERVNRYRSLKDRNRYAVARGTLRRIVAQYTDISPERIEFSYNSHGKPRLMSKECALRFNLSHSHRVALIAIAHGQEIGVDIEFMDGRIDVSKLGPFVFTPCEFSKFNNLPARLQKFAFFRAWTLNEAAVKAVGVGFSYTRTGPMDLSTRRPTRFRSARQLSVRQLASESDYAAALAVAGPIAEVRYFDASAIVGPNTRCAE